MSDVDRAAEMLATAIVDATPDHKLDALMSEVDRLNDALDARQARPAAALPEIERGDMILYWHPDGISYVACFEGGVWVQWPAQRDGWRFRKRVPESTGDACDEIIDARRADLALRLSGYAS